MTISIIARVVCNVGEGVCTFLSSYRFPKRSIHDNFTESSTEPSVFPGGEEEAFRIAGIVAVARAYAKLFAMERANGGTGVQSDAQRKPIKIARRAFY